MFCSHSRYQSLQRSFRRTERPIIHNRNRSVFAGGRGRGQAGAEQQVPRTENNSLSLSLAEAEEMARNLAAHGRSKKKERNSSKGRWFRRSKSKNNSQQTSPDMQAEIPAASSSSRDIRSQGSVSGPRGGVAVGASSAVAAQTPESVGGARTNLEVSPSHQSSFDRELTPASILSAEFESGTEDERSLRQVASPTHSSGHRSSSSDDVMVSAARTTPEGEVAESSESSASGLRQRQSSIVHGSNLTTQDRAAAARARSKSRRRQRLDTDELTNTVGKEGWSG